MIPVFVDSTLSASLHNKVQPNTYKTILHFRFWFWPFADQTMINEACSSIHDTRSTNHDMCLDRKIDFGGCFRYPIPMTFFFATLFGTWVSDVAFLGITQPRMRRFVEQNGYCCGISHGRPVPKPIVHSEAADTHISG